MGRTLRINSIDQNVSVVIYWPPLHGPDAIQNGHAALIISTKTPSFDASSDNYYVSWIGGGAGNLFKRHGVANTFRDDMAQWGGAPTHGLGNMPTRWVAVANLRKDRMKQEWDNIRGKQNAHWKVMDKNCATVVARVLKAGGADQFATKAKHQIVWWPTDLITYARSMNGCIVADSRG